MGDLHVLKIPHSKIVPWAKQYAKNYLTYGNIIAQDYLASNIPKQLQLTVHNLGVAYINKHRNQK